MSGMISFYLRGGIEESRTFLSSLKVLSKTFDRPNHRFFRFSYWPNLLVALNHWPNFLQLWPTHQCLLKIEKRWVSPTISSGFQSVVKKVRFRISDRNRLMELLLLESDLIADLNQALFAAMKAKKASDEDPWLFLQQTSSFFHFTRDVLFYLLRIVNSRPFKNRPILCDGLSP